MLIGFLISLLIVCLVAGLIYWIITMIPLPPPIARVAQVILVVIVVIWLISMLLYPHSLLLHYP